jgi:CRISPR/Cas system CMR-associated protein Cmr5 small subunit
MENLDRLCAEYGHKFADEVSKTENFDAKKAETLITKALGVLQEQGLYAFALFCVSRGTAERAAAEKLKDIATELLKDKLALISGNDLLEKIRREDGLASKLDDFMLTIQVLEKSLIYARYHAKALSNAPEENSVSEGVVA